MSNLNLKKVDETTREIGRYHALESWRNMLSSGRLNAWINHGKNFSIDFHLEALVKIVSSEKPDKIIKVLDVGSGPISMFSKNFEGWNVEVSAADALADDYQALLDELQIDTEHKLVRPVLADSEVLSSILGEKSYDFVIMRNALDHTANPVISFDQLMKVCSPGGYVLIEQFENEAKAEKWEGFHQWNMFFQGGKIMLEGREGEPIDLLASTSVPYREINVWKSKRSSGKGWCGLLIKRTE